MPFSPPIDYVHLRSNESHMQLISMDGSETPSTSPCFNGPPPREPPPNVIFIPGKGTARWWRNRTTLEKILLPALFLLLILSTVLLVVILTLDRRRGDDILATSPTTPQSFSTTFSTTEVQTSTTAIPTTEPKIEICTTPGCVRAANNLLNAMNQSANPCEDFYEFACGAWNANNPIPDDMPASGTFSSVREQVRLQLRVLLEQEIVSSSKSINMARVSYKTCMNKTQLDELKSAPLIESLKTLGNWPILQKGQWDENTFSLTDLLARVRRQEGADVFFQVYVYGDAKRTTKNVLYIDQGTLTLGRGSRDYYLNNTLFANHVDAYRQYMLEGLKLLLIDLNITRDDNKLLSDINEIIEFETELAKITVPEDERRNNTRMYNKRTLKDLSEYLPQVDWVDYFTTISPPDIVHLFNNDTEIIVCEVEFLSKVSNLIKNTRSELLVNYILWKVVQTNVRYLDERFDDIKQDFVRVMTGQMQRSPRWKDCAQVPSTILPQAAGAIYVNAHFASEDKKEAMAMIDLLRSSFTELVKSSDWMDEETKGIAVEKANSMINHIGYPEIVKNNDKLDKEYDELEILKTDTYYLLMQKAVYWMQNKEMRKLLKEFDRREFDISPAVVNAFYAPERNAISFPAGILQPPFFSGSFPKAINYGAMGAVIGHEITHGFDDQGSQYDKMGNLQNWWSSKSMAAFNERKQCIVDQYSDYVVPKTTYRVNGKLTQGENIADNGGLKEAYHAYQNYVKTNGEEKRLPGLEQYSNNQIFFLSYAHFWCGQKKDAAAMQQVLTDEHSPEVFRVKGVLSNLEQFSEAYKCSKSSAFNPEKKCVVW